MGNNTRVLNTTRGFTLKHKQALKAVDECACAWVEFGVSVRDLTIREAVELRAKAKKPVEELPFSEERGLIFRVAEVMQSALANERELARQANEFYRAYGQG